MNRAGDLLLLLLALQVYITFNSPASTNDLQKHYMNNVAIKLLNKAITINNYSNKATKANIAGASATDFTCYFYLFTVILLLLQCRPLAA